MCTNTVDMDTVTLVEKCRTLGMLEQCQWLRKEFAVLWTSMFNDKPEPKHCLNRSLLETLLPSGHAFRTRSEQLDSSSQESRRGDLLMALLTRLSLNHHTCPSLVRFSMRMVRHHIWSSSTPIADLKYMQSEPL
jgi:hypothetical protein